MTFSPGEQIAVLLPLPLANAYDYLVPEDFVLHPGDFVQVPLGKKELTGIVWGKSEKRISPERCREIIAKLPIPPMPEPLRKLVEWIARYTLSSPGSVLRMAMSVPAAFAPVKPSKKTMEPIPLLQFVPPELSDTQSEIAKKLVEKISQGFSVTLLDGVTGSGKTEVYFSAIAETLKQGKQALILLPEISLSSQWLERFITRFGSPPLIWHSEISPARRRDGWRDTATGRISVVTGARSSLFLPFPDLGLIIVDEEHDASFKQEEGVCYHARDMAVVRARLGNHPIILASATPSLESRINAETGRYQLLQLPDRHGGALMPQLSLIDLRKSPPGRQQWLSPILVEAMHETLAAGEQVLLFLNRRGYAPLTLCRSCGYRFQCPHCAAWLVEHRSQKKLQCHHCGFSISPPRNCPQCEAEESFVACGPGVERLAEEVKRIFPDARQAMMTSDSLSSPKAAAAIIEDMENRKIDILIGTQIATKGHHFPCLTLVGVVDADLGLAGGDLRAAERTFQILTQVSGRAGRANRKGKVLLQSYQPEAPVLAALATGNAASFYMNEAESRRAAMMPPFGKLVSLIVSGRQALSTESLSRHLVKNAPQMPGVEIFGPAPAPISLLRGRYRFRLLVKAQRHVNIQLFMQEWMDRQSASGDLRVQVDVDPQSFL